MATTTNAGATTFFVQKDDDFVYILTSYVFPTLNIAAWMKQNVMVNNSEMRILSF